MGCLTGLVGMTSGDCLCIDSEVTAGATLFVDDVEDGISLIPVKNSADCGAGSIIDIITRARVEAERDFITDYNVLSGQTNIVRTRSGSVIYGKLKSNPPISLPLNNLVGIKLMGKDITGMKVTINSLLLSLSNPANPATPRALHITDSLGNDTVISLIPGTAYTNDIILTSDRDYFIYYDRAINGDIPLSNKIKCNCAGTNNALDTYYYINGFNVNTLDDLSDEDGYNNYAYGLTINLKMQCDDLNYWLCLDTDLFGTDGYYRTIAKTYQMYVIKKVISTIINSNAINRYTLLDKEILYGRRARVEKKIVDYMTWLGENLTAHNGCYVCRQSRIMTRQSIMI